MSGIWHHRLVILALLICAACPVFAGSVSAHLEPPVTPFHRPAVLEIRVTSGEAEGITVTGLPETLEGVTLERTDAARVVGEDGMVEEVHRVVLDAKGPVKHVLAGISVKVGEGDAVEIPALVYEARELTASEQDGVAHFAGLTGLEVLDPNPFGLMWWAVGVVGLLLLAGLALWWWRSKVEAPQKPKPIAWEVAEVRLRELAFRKLPEQGKVDAYYVDLSAILRYYIEDRFQVHAPEQTTQEFLVAASERGVLSAEQQDVVSGFLRHCDRVKFAKFEPSMAEMTENFQLVEDFVVQTIPSPAENEDGVGEVAA